MQGSLDIPQGELHVERISFDGGGFSDVFRATWVDQKRRDSLVAVKRFRGLQNIDSRGGQEEIKKMEKRLRIEVATWKRAESHQNVLPFIGLYQEQSVLLPSLVSPYRPDRDIMRFVRTEACDRRILALHILKGVAHLHDLNIIHGDLKPHNVLIDRDENNAPIAQITDFGRAKIVNESGFTGSLSTTIRYTSPEVLGISGEQDHDFEQDTAGNRLLSFHSDVYGMGMTVLELLSNEPPYPRFIQNDTKIIFALCKGQGPAIEDHESPQYPMIWVWNLLSKCWMIGSPPQTRITAKECMDAYQESIDA